MRLSRLLMKHMMKYSTGLEGTDFEHSRADTIKASSLARAVLDLTDRGECVKSFKILSLAHAC